MVDRHTIGPWVNDEIQCGTIYAEKSMVTIAYVVCKSQPTVSNIREQKANAKLIAASPMMLAALRAAREELHAYRIDTNSMPRSLALIDEVIALAETK